MPRFRSSRGVARTWRVVSLTAEGQDRVVLEEEEPVAGSAGTRSSTRRFCRSHASRYAIRPSQVAVIGSSA